MPITWTWLLERSLAARQPLMTIQANSQIQQMGSLGFLPPVVPHLEAARKKEAGWGILKCFQHTDDI